MGQDSRALSPNIAKSRQVSNLKPSTEEIFNESGYQNRMIEAQFINHDKYIASLADDSKQRKSKQKQENQDSKRFEISDRIQHKLNINNEDFKKSIQIIENQQMKSKLAYATSKGSLQSNDGSVELEGEAGEGLLTPYKFQDDQKNDILGLPKLQDQLSKEPSEKEFSAISPKHTHTISNQYSSSPSKVSISAKYQRKQILLTQGQLEKEKAIQEQIEAYGSSDSRNSPPHTLIGQQSGPKKIHKNLHNSRIAQIASYMRKKGKQTEDTLQTNMKTSNSPKSPAQHKTSLQMPSAVFNSIDISSHQSINNDVFTVNRTPQHIPKQHLVDNPSSPNGQFTKLSQVRLMNQSYQNEGNVNRKMLYKPKRVIDKLGFQDEQKISQNHSKLLRNLNRDSNNSTFDSMRRTHQNSNQVNQSFVKTNIDLKSSIMNNAPSMNSPLQIGGSAASLSSTTMGGVLAFNTAKMERMIKLDRKFNQSFVFNPNQANAVTFAQQALMTAKATAVKNTSLGPMMTRKQLQETQELIKVENKYKINETVMSQTPIQKKTLIINTENSSQLNQSQYMSPLNISNSRPNVLGSKEKNLDLLEDQRDQIERIIRKKLKKVNPVLANTLSPSKKLKMALSPSTKGISFTEQRPSIESQGSSLSAGGLKVKELQGLFPNKDPFVEYDSSIKKQKGGGFLPVKSQNNQTIQIMNNNNSYELNEDSSYHESNLVSPSRKFLGESSELKGSLGGSQLFLPKISQLGGMSQNQQSEMQSSTRRQRKDKDMKQAAALKKKLGHELSKNKPNHVSKQRHKASIQNMKDQFIQQIKKATEPPVPPLNVREGEQKSKGGQPNKNMNMNINVHQKKIQELSIKKSKKNKNIDIIDEVRDRSQTPESMKNGLNEIMANNTFLDQIITNDSRMNKDKREQYQQDFEMKMEKMNYQLQKEFENHQLGLTKPQNSLPNTVDRSPKLGVSQKLEEFNGIKVLQSLDPHKTDQILHCDIQSQANVKKKVLPNKNRGQSSKHLMSIDKSVKIKQSNFPKYDRSSNRVGSNLKSVKYTNMSTDSAGVVHQESEDWLSIQIASQRASPPPDQFIANAQNSQEGPIRYERQDSRVYERLYTPPAEENAMSNDQPSYFTARHKEVEEKMMKLKQAQREEYEERDDEVLGGGKDADHLDATEIKDIEATYAPIIDKIETKLRALDQDKKVLKPSGQIASVSAAVDQSSLKSQAIENFIGGIQQRQEFYGVAKHATQAIIAQKAREDPRATFYAKCQKECVIALPTLAKVKNKVLNLKGYKLNYGLCQALGKAFLLYHDLLEKLLLESVGADDQMLAALLDGLKEQVNFKSVTYKKNSLGPLSVKALSVLINRTRPSNLDELRIINCKISTASSELLLESIQGSQLRRLALVKCHIDSQLFEHIIALVEESQSLKELDISWNRLTPRDLGELFKVLASNRQLQKLNISWNHVQEMKIENFEEQDAAATYKADLEARIEEAKEIAEAATIKRDEAFALAVEEAKEKGEDVPAPEDAPVVKEQAEYEKLKQELADLIELDESLDEDEEEILQNLGKFMKNNKQLQEVNLSHCQIKHNLLRELCSCLRRSKSILVLNVNGNPGVSDELRKYLSEKIRCLPNPYDLERYNYIQAYVNDVNKAYDLQSGKNEKILESMQVRNIREITSTQESNKITEIRTFQDNENLIFQRVLGHKDEIPGSAQWIETSVETSPPDNLTDWLSDKNIYTLIFWSKKLGKQVQATSQYTSKEISLITQLLKNPDLAKTKKIAQNLKNDMGRMPFVVNNEVIAPRERYQTPPMLAGSFNKWQYHQMFKIKDLVAMMDSSFEDPITELIEKGQIKEGITKPTELNKQEFYKYVKYRMRTEKYMRSNWLCTLLHDCIRYKHPCLINLTEFDDYPPDDNQKSLQALEDLITDPNMTNKAKYSIEELDDLINGQDDEENQLWVGVAMSKPGKHTYIVRYEEKEESNATPLRLTAMSSVDSVGKQLMQQSQNRLTESGAQDRAVKYSLHRCLIQARQEEVPYFAKAPKSKTNERVFNKETSVFRDWKEPPLNQPFKSDIGLWKLHRFVKDQDEAQRGEQVLWNNFEKIKKIFILEAARSGFPCINWIKYSDFCAEAGIVDKNFPLATIDRIFIATNVELEKTDDNPPTALQRYEFMECLARIAQGKFKDSGIVKTLPEAIEKLLDEHVLKMGEKGEWQEFRDKQLWTCEVNDVFESNLDLLKKIYQSYLKPMQKLMTQKDAESFMMRDNDLQLIEKDAIYCYGLCKMTVVKENENSKQYFQLQFVEFIEMIGRIAELKFKSTSTNEEPLDKRIEFILDEIIPPMLQVPRRPRTVQIQEESESDDDY